MSVPLPSLMILFDRGRWEGEEHLERIFAHRSLRDAREVHGCPNLGEGDILLAEIRASGVGRCTPRGFQDAGIIGLSRIVELAAGVIVEQNNRPT